MLGFVILSHRSPKQLLRLCRTLSRLYGDPPIACHHDFAQHMFDPCDFPSNVRFVLPSIATAWAKWSLIEATLAGLKLLYDEASPDVFYVISAADYPTASAETVIADLARSNADVHIDAFPLRTALNGDAPTREALVGDLHLAHHRAPHNLSLERDRYLNAQLRIPIIRLRPPAHSTTTNRYPRLGGVTIALPITAPASPFNRSYQCYVGSQWFTGNKRVAYKLLHPAARDSKLQRYYRSRIVPDESYFQTVLCNDKSLLWENRTFRYAQWDGAHPIDLTEHDLDAILASGAHFSRKFREDDPVLDQIDAAIMTAGR